MSNIQIRLARYSELPAVSRLMGTAFFDDDLFGAIIHPHRKEYPEHVNLYWLRRAYVHYWDYRWRWLVAVHKDPATEQEQIVGLAQWERLGDGGKRLECGFYDPRAYFSSLHSLAMKLHALIWPNRACDPINEDILERAYPNCAHMWSGDRAESWYLEFLGVHPDFQNRGIGRQLVQWGLDRSEEEGIVASVASTRGKEEFYQKCGFDEEEGLVSMGEKNPLREWGSGRMFWRKPRAGLGKKT